jgi:hypothetical protein
MCVAPRVVAKVALGGIMSIRKLDGGEELVLIDISSNDRRVYELDVYDAINRESGIRRDKEDVVRFKVSLDKHLTNEIDSIGDVVECSEEKIRSALVMHGLSIIQFHFGEAIKEIGRLRIELINCNISEIQDKAGSLNETIYERQTNVKRRNVTIPKEIAGAVNKVCKPMFLDSTTFYQICMAFSLFTRHDMIPLRKKHFEKQVDAFLIHIRSQYILFKGLHNMIEVYHNNEEFKSMFDICEFVSRYVDE